MIERHKIKDIFLELLSDDYEGSLETLSNIKSNDLIDGYLLESLYDQYKELAAFEILLHNDQEKCFDYLKKCAEVIYSLYDLAEHIGESVQIIIDDIPPYSLPGEIRYGFITPWNFANHLQIAWLTRDRKLIAKLSNFDQSKFAPDEAGLSGPGFHTNYAQFLQSLIKSEQQKGELLKEINNLISETKEFFEDDSMDYEDTNIYFELHFLKHLFERDDKNLNQDLEKRILNFKKTFSDAGNATDPSGFFAYKVSGLAAYAYDKGLEITIESDYLPRLLIEGKYKMDEK